MLLKTSIMPAFCSVILNTYYAQNIAGIKFASLGGGRKGEEEGGREKVKRREHTCTLYASHVLVVTQHPSAHRQCHTMCTMLSIALHSSTPSQHIHVHVYSCTCTVQCFPVLLMFSYVQQHANIKIFTAPSQHIHACTCIYM